MRLLPRWPSPWLARLTAPGGPPVTRLLRRAGAEVMAIPGRYCVTYLLLGAETVALVDLGSRADIEMDWESLREAGSALGAGAVVVVAEGADLLALGENLTAFFRNESCGKCVPCRIGTEKAVGLIARREAAGLALLPELDEALRETPLCGLG